MSVHRGNRGGGGPADPQQQQPQTTTISHANCRKVWDFCQVNSIINVSLLEPVVCTYRASKKEFSTSYLFEEQETCKGSEWLRIDLD